MVIVWSTVKLKVLSLLFGYPAIVLSVCSSVMVIHYASDLKRFCHRFILVATNGISDLTVYFFVVLPIVHRLSYL